MTGITEAAKSRTPLLVLAAEATSPLSNFYVDQTGAGRRRRRRADAGDVARLGRGRSGHGVLDGAPRAAHGAAQPAARRPGAEVPAGRDGVSPTRPPTPTLPGRRGRRRPPRRTRSAAAERPVFIAGRGARGAGAGALERLAESAGALLATSAVANGLFEGDPWSLGISGGFASPLAVELIRDADLIVGWGCALNMWTMGHGALIGRAPRSCRWTSRRRRSDAPVRSPSGVVGDVAGDGDGCGRVARRDVPTAATDHPRSANGSPGKAGGATWRSTTRRRPSASTRAS